MLQIISFISIFASFGLPSAFAPQNALHGVSCEAKTLHGAFCAAKALVAYFCAKRKKRLI